MLEYGLPALPQPREPVGCRAVVLRNVRFGRFAKLVFRIAKLGASNGWRICHKSHPLAANT